MPTRTSKTRKQYVSIPFYDGGAASLSFTLNEMRIPPR